MTRFYDGIPDCITADSLLQAAVLADEMSLGKEALTLRSGARSLISVCRCGTCGSEKSWLAGIGQAVIEAYVVVIAANAGGHSPYKIKVIKIPKKSGGFRTIYCPPSSLKKRLRQRIPALTRLAMILDKERIMHGFMPCRSAVTNALEHVGYQYSMCFDLKDFFDHCTFDRFREAVGWITGDLSGKMLELFGMNSIDDLFPMGAARQGLPTSPIIANICFRPLDEKISEWLKRYRDCGLKIAYTRYADDLTFSFNEIELRELLKEFVTGLCAAGQFPINEKKTRFQAASRGRRIITGVAVDGWGVHPTRQSKRKLRAAKHQDKKNHARGLSEWCKVKPPNYGKWALKSILEDRHGLTVIRLAGIGASE